MILLIAMPGGTEWLLIIFSFSLIFISPVLAIIFFIKNKALSKQIRILQEEREGLLGRLPHRK
ncbi:MAG: hypothetical protein JWQ96_1429 [Segetibacter sp.]|nr:hypothetical protein [Segetibacter sp.]